MSVWTPRADLDDLYAKGLRRRPRRLEPVDAVTARTVDGRELLVFCSNDYLGLSQEPQVIEAWRDTAGRAGVGAGAAHLISGHRPQHEALETELADWLGRDRVLLFSTGYMANLGVIAALVGRGERLFQDRLNHASLLDAGLLSGARQRRYRHGDSGQLEGWLTTEAVRQLVVTDGVFSMDGDVAPLADLACAAGRHDAMLLADDAHGLGVLGPAGSGSVAEAGLGQSGVPLLVGTLGKALGTAGAFVAGSGDWIDWLRHKARTYVYTTAPPPAQAAATTAAVRLARSQHWRRDHLTTLIRRFRDGAAQLGLQLMPSRTPIQPLVIGEVSAATAASEALEARGFLVTAIRPPTVPPGSARLRVTLSAAHSEAQVDRLLDALADLSLG